MGRHVVGLFLAGLTLALAGCGGGGKLALAPGATWSGEISARGSLPARAWVRLSFGAFVAVGDPPEGVEPRVVWITDHAYPL